MIQEIKNSCTKISQTKVMTLTKIIYMIQDFDHQHKLNSHQLAQISKEILKELDVEYNDEQENKQSNNKHLIK